MSDVRCQISDAQGSTVYLMQSEYKMQAVRIGNRIEDSTGEEEAQAIDARCEIYA